MTGDTDDKPMPAMHHVVRSLNSLEAAIYQHCGYEPQWRVFPFMDELDSFWSVEGERGEVRTSEDRGALERWLATDDDEPDGDKLYNGQIYTQRHHEKWIYRGAEITLVLVDTGCDLNIWLAIYDNTKELPWPKP